MARPGQVRDGYFPDAVFADPRYIMPVIYAALDEWINGKPSFHRFVDVETRRPTGVLPRRWRAAQKRSKR